jgi:multidrug efflux pump subunit AcrB
MFLAFAKESGFAGDLRVINGDRFIDLTIVLLISVAAIFLALVCQFKNAIKPFIVFAAVPFGMVGALAAHGPLWEPLCYAQIGGLSVATFITLLLVPVIYSSFVLDLKLVKWERDEALPQESGTYLEEVRVGYEP